MAKDDVLKDVEQNTLSPETLLPIPSLFKVAPELMVIDDPNVIEVPELIREYVPSKLLTAYCEANRKLKVKFEKSVTQENSQICKCRFYSPEYVIPTSATHPTKIYNATQYAAQKMLVMLFPKVKTWLECVEHVKSFIAPKIIDDEIMIIDD